MNSEKIFSHLKMSIDCWLSNTVDLFLAVKEILQCFTSDDRVHECRRYLAINSTNSEGGGDVKQPTQE